MPDEFYAVFAQWANKHGVEATVQRFSSRLAPEVLQQYAATFDEQVAAVKFGGPAILRAGGTPWYSGPTDDDDYWPPLYSTFLAEGWTETELDPIDRASSVVVAHTPSPSRKKFAAKGLVVGYVQSGKTTNFTSVIAKLADNGYRFVVVLSGVHNGLRKQTQARLQRQLQGGLLEKWHLLTKEDSDFQIPPNPPAAMFADDRVVLAVVKKNATVLARLTKWLDTAAGRQKLASIKVLIVDDEADQASVATPTINPMIRKLLDLAPAHTYVGYTATPFANVFIDPKADDLYPKDFILNLPRPDNYFGPDVIFGEGLSEDEDGADDGYDMVRIVPRTDVTKLRPASQSEVATFAPTVTVELRDAVRWFWLATAARRARSDRRPHSTMLIHTAVPIAVHEAYRAPLQALRESMTRELDDPASAMHHELRAQWAAEVARVDASAWGRTQNQFDELAPYLREVVEQTRIILDNYQSTDRLTYSDEEPTVAIAVGGNTLSRGLTLEGLVVSFFVRSASTYDTLMQMGRWFGFRRGYEDLPRIWMTDELRSQFRHLVAVEREMRADIDYYQTQDLTPLEAAVRIRTHPALRITAKMGAAQPAYVSFAGRRLQTRYFLHKDGDWLEKNLRAADRLLEDLEADFAWDPKGSARVYRDVGASVVLQFLRDYTVHEDSPDVDTDLMIEYIQQRMTDDEPSLEDWSVAIMGTAGGVTIDLAGQEWHAVRRSRMEGDGERADIKTLMSKPDRVLDLAITSAEAEKRTEPELMRLRDDDDVHKLRGLLVVYPIDPQSEPDPNSKGREALDAELPVIGMGIVFPGQAEERKRLQPEVMAVDLSDVFVDDEAAFEEDTEGEG